MNLEQAFLNGIYGFVVSASFIGCWIVLLLFSGLLSRIFGGKDTEDGDE